METNHGESKPIASKAAAIVFGILAGIGSLVHGIGEVLQGDAATPGIWVNSWAQGPIADYMGGEPGITILPSFLLAGILTIIASVAVIVWSAAFVNKKAGGLILIILSVIMLLTGGGAAPPLLGILAGVAGLAVHAPLNGWKNAPAKTRRFFGALWPWIYGISALIVVFLVIGSFSLVYLINFNNPDLFTYSFFLSVILLILLNITGRAYDAQRMQNG